MLEKVKKKGLKKQISYKGHPEEVYYYICFVNERYIWLYENLTGRKFKATFRFELMNLKIERDEEEKKNEKLDENEWDIFLEPKQS